MEQIEQTLTSIEVAEMVGKDHKELLRDVRRYSDQIDELGESNIALTDFFQESTYVNQQNKELPCYLITKKGCEFIGNKLTGVKGTEFTAKYINRFHDMEEIIRKPKSTMEILELEMQALKEINLKVESVDQDLQQFKLDMPLLGLECDKITSAVRTKGVNCLNGKSSAAYQDKSLRGKVYADIYGQLKREFAVGSYKAIKRGQTELAVEIINGYRTPLVLQEEISNCNAQMAFE